MKKLSVSVVIPVLNEEKTLGELQKRLVNSLFRKYSPEYIYIDDASSDNSPVELHKIKNRFKNVTIIEFKRHKGKTAALAEGVKRAKGELTVMIDADLQDEPSEIPKLIDKLQQGFDLVSGWRFRRNDNGIKIFFSKIFNLSVRMVTGINLHDFNTGLKVGKSEVFKKIPFFSESHRYISVLAVYKGFKVTEVKVKHKRRKYGKSKFGISRFLIATRDLKKVLTYRNQVKIQKAKGKIQS